MTMIGFDAAAVCAPHAAQLRALGYAFACRYYRRTLVSSWAISPTEAAVLCGAGLRLVSVFQHTSDTPNYFRAPNARIDATAALTKAKQMAQPAGSAVYFAVDCNPDDAQVADVLAYFSVVRDAFMHSGYTIGVYGSGLVCRRVRDESLAQHAWLTNARGWRETRTYQDWAIKQSLPIKLPFGLEIDPNEAIDPLEAGMWSYR